MASAKIVHTTGGESVKPFGLDMKILLSGAECGDTTSVILATHKPGEGPPPHFHASQDECFFVIEGDYEVSVDGVVSQASPGTLVFLPRNTVHGFRNTGTTDAKMLDWSLPAGQDSYFRTVHQQQQEGSFNPVNMGELSGKFDTYFPVSAD